MGNHAIYALIGVYVFMAAVTALPKQGFKPYDWFYDFVHALLPVAQGVLKARFPNAPAPDAGQKEQ